MSQKSPLGSTPVGDPGTSASSVKLFDVLTTVLSQYANSPVLLAIITSLADAFDATADVDAFYESVWNVGTAQGYGLDVLGRIVGVNRVLHIPSNTAYLGWQQQTEAQPFGFGVFYNGTGATQNYSLTDDAYRRLILAKCALNICDGSIPAINAVLLALFPQYGNSYVQDNGGMAMTYVFGGSLTAIDYAIVSQSGVLPKPIGVTVNGIVTS